MLYVKMLTFKNRIHILCAVVVAINFFARNYTYIMQLPYVYATDADIKYKH